MRRTKKKSAAGQRHGVLRAQGGLCPLCRDFLLYADHEPQSPREWEQWVKVVNRALRTKWIVAESVQRRTGVTVVTRLVHGHCLRRVGNGTANLANEPIGLA